MSQSNTETMRDDAKRFFLAGVGAAKPRRAVREALQPLTEEIDAAHHLTILAIGKAAMEMADEALKLCDRSQNLTAIVVTNPENVKDHEHMTVFASAHPVPDAVGLQASAHVAEVAKRSGEGDLVLALISGGGSALLPAPVKGISLDDKMALSKLLLEGGLDIVAMNHIRQQISYLKGGGLARLASPAKVITLAVSDVPGDDIRVIASGPTAEPIGTPQSAMALLQEHGLWDDSPASVKNHLLQAQTKPVAGLDHVQNHVIGSNAISVKAAKKSAEMTYKIITPSDWLEGDVEEAAHFLFHAAKQHELGDRSLALICGGETNVRVRGTGKGGRNQELALRFARLVEAEGLARDWVFLSAGTDGRDGPTNAAGGLVDASTLDKIRKSGMDFDHHLTNNDAFHLLEAADHLVMTGGTGTNVADMQILLMR